MRGKVAFRLFAFRGGRITPAYAGKRAISICRAKKKIGSPPPMRGKDLWNVHRPPRPRITPAYAGKSVLGDQCYHLSGDHPRLCGEKYGCIVCVYRGRGSPPPMRGKVMLYIDRHVTFRITPAYAGKRHGDLLQNGVMGDHPRLCGEKYPFSKERRMNSGSPPPMRGKVFHVSSVRNTSRITPAYAGKSSHFSDCTAGKWDHPRLCGEKWLGIWQ